MFYGDLHLLDILLFAGVAAFLFYRLRGVLGKREGFEKKSNEKYENILDIQDKPKEKKTQKPPELEEKFKQLETAYENLDFFDHISFLENAKSAFETIVGLFNDNNKEEFYIRGYAQSPLLQYTDAHRWITDRFPHWRP